MRACSFAFGGRGIFFGGKNILLSELSGAFAIAAEVDNADRLGDFRSARITVQFGGPHLASAQRYLLYHTACSRSSHASMLLEMQSSAYHASGAVVVVWHQLKGNCCVMQPAVEALTHHCCWECSLQRFMYVVQ